MIEDYGKGSHQCIPCSDGSHNTVEHTFESIEKQRELIERCADLETKWCHARNEIESLKSKLQVAERYLLKILEYRPEKHEIDVDEKYQDWAEDALLKIRGEIYIHTHEK